jgi:FlaG/FlaF family flagellin (archaellin)
MVAITVVLAAVVYVTVTSIVQETQSLAPFVALGQPEIAGNTATLSVAATGGRTYNLANFDVVLVMNGSIDEASKISPLTEGTFGNLTFGDTTGEGKLSAGDTFTVTLVPETRYTLSVVYRGKGESGNQDWTTP